MPKRSLAGDDATKEGFTGHELDAETGLNYAGARYYDPEIGRWLAVDPLWQLTPDINAYHYVRNNPLSFIDPDGMREIDCRGDGITSNDPTEENGYSQGDWCKSDRLNDTERWREANRLNLGLVDGYSEYTSGQSSYGTKAFRSS